MNYFNYLRRAARLRLFALTAFLLFAGISQVRAQLGAYTFGRPNVNEGGTVLCRDPQGQGIFVGGYRNDSTLIMLIDFNGNIIDEICFKVSMFNGGVGHRDVLSDLKFNVTNTEMVGTGIDWEPASGSRLGGYCFQLFTSPLTLGWVRYWPNTIPAAGRTFTALNVQDTGTDNFYRVYGTSYAGNDGAFVRVNKITGVPGPFLHYALVSPEDFAATVIDPTGNIFATSRFGHGVALSTFRPGLARLTPAGAILSDQTYLEVFPTSTIGCYSTDVIMNGDRPVTVGFGDFTNSGALNNNGGWWSQNDINCAQVSGFSFTLSTFLSVIPREVLRVPPAVAGATESYILFGDGNNSTAAGAAANQFFLMSMNPNGTQNWAYSYGEAGREFVTLTSQQQLITVNNGPARLAFTGTTTSYATSATNTPEDIIVYILDQNGTLGGDFDCDTAITATFTPRLANNQIALTSPNAVVPNQAPVPPVRDPNLQDVFVCGNQCFAAIDSDYVHITAPTTFNSITSTTGTETWTGKYYVGADVTIDGIVLDVTETDVVFAPCTRITFINGARLRANNSTFRPCNEDESWDGLYFTSTSSAAGGQLEASAVVNECVFKNAVDALRFEPNSATPPPPARYDARITNNLFVNCLTGVRIPGPSQVVFTEGITGNTFTVDERAITWSSENAAGICTPFTATTYFGIRASTTTFEAQVSQNDFVNTSDQTTALDLTGIFWDRCNGTISLNNFTNNFHSVQLGSCSRVSVENNHVELTQLYSPFQTQILLQRGDLIWITGNELVSSTEEGSVTTLGAAISVEDAGTVNVKENEVDGFSDAIQLFRSSGCNVMENVITNSNIVGVYVQAGNNNTVSCNQIKLRDRLNGPNNAGILYLHTNTAAATLTIKSNCITDTKNAIFLFNLAGGNVALPVIHNNYLYNYSRTGILSSGFTGSIGSGIATAQQAGRNTFVSNHIVGGALDINTSGFPVTAFGNYGVSSVAPAVTLVGGNLYNSITSCGNQIGTVNSTIAGEEICDTYFSNLDLSMVRVGLGNFGDFMNDTWKDRRGAIAGAIIRSLVLDNRSQAALNFHNWAMAGDYFTAAEKTWIHFVMLDASGEVQAVLDHLPAMEAADPGMRDWVSVESIRRQLALEGRTLDELNATEVAALEAIDEAREFYADDARDLLHVAMGRYPHILKPCILPELPAATVNALGTDQPRIHLFPNPANTDQVTVEYVLTMANGASLRVVDAMGRLVTTRTLEADVTAMLLDVTDWAPGMYVVSVENGDGSVQTAKLLIQ